MANLNATHLFERPHRYCHNSESWWSAFFSLFLLYQARNHPAFYLPIKRCATDSEFPEIGRLACVGLQFSDVIVENPLNAQSFGLPEWPTTYQGLSPDLTIFERSQRRVTFIETKTIGAEIKEETLHKYLGACEYLGEKGWTASLCFLLSHGYEKPSQWNLIAEHELRVILWEDVLRAVAKEPIFRQLFYPEDLLAYATSPKENSGANRPFNVKGHNATDEYD
jgi:hypothetical protein